MNALFQYLKSKHDSKACIVRYHRHKEWVFFVALFSTILFLMVWSGWVNYKISNLEESMNYHEHFDKEIVEAQLIILQELRTDNAELHAQAIRKLTELNQRIRRHYDDDRK